MSVLTAARVVLADASQPLTPEDIYHHMADQGLWRNPHDRPDAVVAAAIASDIGRRGGASDFRRSGQGRFARVKRRGAERLPRVTLDDALRVLLGWRDDPARFDAGAVAWHARLAGHAPNLTLADSEAALTALRGLRGPAPEWAARRLSELAWRHGLNDVAVVLEDWVEQHRGRECC